MAKKKERKNRLKKGMKRASARAQAVRKKYSLKERAFGLIELARPLEWSKPLLNMTIAALIAFYVFSAQFSLELFAIGFVSVAMLWSGLYALNDFTDTKLDAAHAVKKNRPIPSGKISPRQALFFSSFLITLSLFIAFSLIENIALTICLLAMLANQLFYTLEPWRLKSRKIFDIISGSMINPLFRYLSGLALFMPFHGPASAAFPILPIIFVIAMQFSGYSLYRAFSKSHDIKMKMKSTIAAFGEKKVKLASYIVAAIGIIAYFGMIANGITVMDPNFGYLPFQYIWSIIPVLFFLPMLKGAILSPEKSDLKGTYRIFYAMTIAFIIGNAAVFAILP
ncbi:MAG: UbiA family prenyltransferase [archaeon]|jgi:4-hydroxybenzoate polyprenyltransferase